jgi:hypothetical protein
VHVHIGQAGDALDPFGDPARERVVGRAILADQLDIDGRRQAKIENLADDVGGLVKENEIRKALRQLAAQGADIIKGRSPMPGFERDQNLAIGRTDRGRITECQVDAAQRQADIVQYQCGFFARNDAPDGGLDGVENLVRLFEPRAGGGAHMQTKLAGVDERKKVPAGQRHHQDRAAQHDREFAQHQPAMMQRPLKPGAVFFAHSLEAPVERAVDAPKNISFFLRAAFVVACDFAGQ